jgi:hypothetical protein
MSLELVKRLTQPFRHTGILKSSRAIPEDFMKYFLEHPELRFTFEDGEVDDYDEVWWLNNDEDDNNHTIDEEDLSELLNKFDIKHAFCYDGHTNECVLFIKYA